MDRDTLALLRSECKGIESLQGRGSKGDASCTTHGFYVTLILFFEIFFSKIMGQGLGGKRGRGLGGKRGGA